MEVQKILFTTRLKEIFKSIQVWKFVFLGMLLPISLLIITAFDFLFCIPLLTHLCFNIPGPQVWQSKMFVYKIDIKEENMYIYYLLFNTPKVIITNRLHVKIAHFKANAKTIAGFRLYYYDGKTYKRILTQYRVGEWKNDETMEGLKNILTQV